MLLSTRRFSLPPAHPFTSVQREMESFLGHLLNNGSENGVATRSWRAVTAVWEDADKFFLDVELPGVTKDGIDVTVHNGTLRVTGERKAPEGERKYWVNDRVYGTFDRAVNLPEDIDPDSIDAQLTDGVLHIVLTKRPEAQPKKVTVKD